MSKNLNIEEYPEWIDDVFVYKIAQKCTEIEDVQVNSYDLSYLCGRGESYGAILYRLTIDYLDGDVSKSRDLVVKTAITDNAAAVELQRHTNIFLQEIIMFKELKPLYMGLLGQFPGAKKFMPDAYYFDKDVKVIVMEDLSVKGYRTWCRKERLNEHQAKLVLDKLAIIHACSMVIQEENLYGCSQFKTGLINQKNRAIARFYELNMEALIRCLSGMGPDYEKYVQKCTKLLPNMYRLAADLIAPKPGELACLNHGDMWTTNAMCKFDPETQEQLDDVLFVDFQYICWASPVLDLHYFFNTSLKEDLRRNGLQDLLKYYLTSLNAVLKSFHCVKPLPDLSEFKKMYEDKMLLTFIYALLAQPTSICEGAAEAEADIGALLDDTPRSRMFKNNLYTNPKVIDNIKYFLPILDALNVLDC